MIEALLGLATKAGANDNSDIPFPAGTPFKGITRSSEFIYGDTLAALVGLGVGGSMNVDGGWLHFIETSGLELYIAKKPIRYAATYEAIMVATNNGNKEVTIRGDVYICRMLTGLIVSNGGSSPSNAGGEWNRYMYPVYDNTDRALIPTAPIWGDYTWTMLGLGDPSGNDLSNGVFSICAEKVGGSNVVRGNDWQLSSGGCPVMGIWTEPPDNPQIYYGWRPVLVKKSSIPPTPYIGQVAGADLITADDLATELGITGTVMPDTNPGWLKFVDNGKTFYIAQKPFRCSVLWETLDGIGAVKGTKVITVGGKQYAVRLMTGSDTDPASVGGGEYDNYFARVTTHYSGGASESWGNLSDDDIGWFGSTGTGELSLCQEQYGGNGPLTRGYPGFAGLWYQGPGATHTGYGWRPVLEELP